MTWKIRLFLAIAGLILYCQSTALAQSPCVPTEAGLAWVAENYGESPLFEGQMAQGTQRLVLTWNAETGTWSLLVTPPGAPDALCMAASGEGGKPAAAPAKAPGNPL